MLINGTNCANSAGVHELDKLDKLLQNRRLYLSAWDAKIHHKSLAFDGEAKE